MELEVKKESFANVYGYDEVKKELSLIKSWYKDKKVLNDKKVMLPKGILFHGVPGCGKTLLLREFSSSFNAPTFVINGKSDNLSKEIIDTFKKAREEDFAIVLIDELDLLVGGSARIERVIQEELDGIETKGKILVLATTNHMRHIDEALTRPGRFDRCIEISYPDKASRKKIFEKYLEALSINTKDIDIDHVVKVATRCNGAEIKAIVNDVYLRCKDNITTDDLEISYGRIVRDDYSSKPEEHKDMRVAVHEAGHAIMCLHFNKNWSFYRAKFNKTGGVTELQEADECVDSFEKREQDLMIGLSGYLAEELYYGKHDIGSYRDYYKLYGIAKGFIERSGFKGFKHYIEPYDDNDDRFETTHKREVNEKIVGRLIKKYEKKTRRYLKKHMKEVTCFANLMYKNGSVSYKEVRDTIRVE